MSAKMGSYMAKKQAKGMLAPLLEEDESSTDSDDTGDSGNSSSSKVETVKKGLLEKLKSTIGECCDSVSGVGLQSGNTLSR